MASLKRARVESLESRRLLSASISGIVYQDIGAVGSLQPGDPPLGGWTVYLDLNHDSTLTAGDPTAVTDASGRYTFSNVAAGTYDVREEPVTGFKPIPDAFQTVSVTDGQTLANLDFGNQKLVDFSYPGLSAAQDSVNNYNAITPTDAAHSSIAINGKYIVTITGNSISTYRRDDGTLLTTQSLAEFFSLSSLAQPNTAQATDAQVIYDAGTGKFFVAALANGADGTSDILMAGSPRLAPNSALWHYHSINAQEITPGETTVSNVLASNLSLSFNGSAIYITANINDPSGTFVGSRLWMMARGKAFATTVTKLVDYIYDPSAEVSLPELSNIDAANFSGKSIGGIGAAYFVADAPVDTGGLLDIITVRRPGNKAIFSLNKFAAPSDISIASTQLSPAIQPDGATSIDTADTALDAVWRKQYFWIADTLTPTTGPDAGNATVYWFQFHLPNYALLNDGSVSGSSISPGASTFAPSIAIDRDQYMALTFSASGPNLDPGTYVVSRRTPDPAHVTRPAYTLNAGTSTYSSTTNASGLVNWGSNSMVLDPLAQERFWILAHAAADPSSSTGPWSQQIIGLELPPKKFPVING